MWRGSLYHISCISDYVWDLLKNPMIQFYNKTYGMMRFTLTFQTLSIESVTQ